MFVLRLFNKTIYYLLNIMLDIIHIHETSKMYLSNATPKKGL